MPDSRKPAKFEKRSHSWGAKSAKSRRGCSFGTFGTSVVWGLSRISSSMHPGIDGVAVRRTARNGLVLHTANPPRILQDIQSRPGPFRSVQVRPVVAVNVPHGKRAIAVDLDRFTFELGRKISRGLHRSGYHAPINSLRVGFQVCAPPGGLLGLLEEHQRRIVQTALDGQLV